MSSLRSAFGSRLPHRWTNCLREVVRGIDQLAGLPLSPWRPGAVILYHVGRCGSSVLGEMLDRHPAVRWDREIYFHRWARTYRPFRPNESERFLRRRMWAAGRRWYGFEMKFLAQQHLGLVGLSLPEFVAETERAGVTHHVVLRRRNALRRTISAAAGIRSGTRHARANEPSRTPEPVRFEVDRVRLFKHREPLHLVTALDAIEEGYDQLESLLAGRRALHLTFEEDVAAAGPQRAYARVCDFLGLAARPVAPHTQRLHARPVRELLANFEEVAAVLRGTRHAWMLEE